MGNGRAAKYQEAESMNKQFRRLVASLHAFLLALLTQRSIAVGPILIK